MMTFSWHDHLLALSGLASILGIIMLVADLKAKRNIEETTDYMLLLMAFAYWLVYCFAVGLQRFILPQWEIVLLSVKLLGVLSYLLTATCVLSLPLHRVSSRQIE